LQEETLQENTLQQTPVQETLHQDSNFLPSDGPSDSSAMLLNNMHKTKTLDAKNFQWVLDSQDWKLEIDPNTWAVKFSGLESCSEREADDVLSFSEVHAAPEEADAAPPEASPEKTQKADAAPPEASPEKTQNAKKTALNRRKERRTKPGNVEEEPDTVQVQAQEKVQEKVQAGPGKVEFFSLEKRVFSLVKRSEKRKDQKKAKRSEKRKDQKKEFQKGFPALPCCVLQ